MWAREWIATLVEVSIILELVTADASRLDESLHFRNVCLHLHDGGEKYLGAGVACYYVLLLGQIAVRFWEGGQWCC